MLYDRWRQVAEGSADRPALRDWSVGREWTFRELAREAERAEPEPGPVAFPQGISAGFIMAVLRAWRAGQAVCPVELEQAPPVIREPLPEGIAHLKTTSATAGDSRFVAFTAPQLMADSANIVATMGLRPDWPNIGVISLAHSYGFSNLVLPLLLHGIPLILAGGVLPELLRRAAASEQAVTLAAVPALWRAWHDADCIPATARLAISAGAPLPVALEQAIFAMRGLKVHNFYGCSECGGIAYDAMAGPRGDGACAGAPLKGVQVSTGDLGCLEVRSRAVGETYWPEPGVEVGNGIFRSRDLAEISYGLVYLRGRLDDQINVAGRKVCPESIEKVLLSHPGIRDCLIFGIPSADTKHGEAIVAAVVADGNSGASNEALRQFLLSRLPAWQVPRDWWRVETIAANNRGKLSRAAWRKSYLENRGRGR